MINTSEKDALINQYEKRIYDLRQLLEISRSLCSTLEFTKLIQSVLYTCMGQFRVLGAGIFVLNSFDADSFQLDSNYSGIDINPNFSYKILLTDPLVTAFEKDECTYTFEELKELVPTSAYFDMLATLNPSLIVPMVQKGHLEGILVLSERISVEDSNFYSDDEKEQIGIIASLAAIAINNAVLVERSSTDMMTHLRLKYYFFNVLSEKLDIALQNAGSLAVVMFDIDFFKRFNDTYGHACGDYVLQTVAKIIRSAIRSSDMAARYGGEEFCVLLNNTCQHDAMTVAERIRSKIEQFDFCYENQHVQVTISIGVSEFDIEKNPVTSPKLLVDQADQALYVSKRNGRNRVTFADSKMISEIKLMDK